MQTTLNNTMLPDVPPFSLLILASAMFSIIVGLTVFLCAQRRTNQTGRRALTKGAERGALMGALFSLCFCTLLTILEKCYSSSFGGAGDTTSETGLYLAARLYTPAIVPAVTFMFLNTVYLYTAVRLFCSSFDLFWTGVFSCASLQLGLWTGLGFALAFQFKNGADVFLMVDEDTANQTCTYTALVVALGFVPALLLKLKRWCSCSDRMVFWLLVDSSEMSEPLQLLSSELEEEEPTTIESHEATSGSGCYVQLK